MPRAAIMRATLILSAALLVAGPAVGQTADENWTRCKDANSDLAIGGCTAVIRSGQETTANLAVAFYGRGTAYYEKGRYGRAIREYDEAIRLNPDFAEAFNSRGTAYHAKGQYNRAIRDYDEAIRLKPDYADAINNRSQAQKERGKYD
jgi:tetratricopeptide (TPR) repeat protein